MLPQSQMNLLFPLNCHPQASPNVVSWCHHWVTPLHVVRIYLLHSHAYQLSGKKRAFHGETSWYHRAKPGSQERTDYLTEQHKYQESRPLLLHHPACSLNRLWIHATINDVQQFSSYSLKPPLWLWGSWVNMKAWPCISSYTGRREVRE